MISMLCVSARVPRLKEKRPPLCPGFCGWDYGGGSWRGWGVGTGVGGRGGGEPCCGHHGNHRAAEVGAVTLGRGCPAGWALGPGRKPWPPCPLPPAWGCGDLGWSSAHRRGLPGSVPAALCAAHTPPSLTAFLPQPRASPCCGGKEPCPGHTTVGGCQGSCPWKEPGCTWYHGAGGLHTAASGCPRFLPPPPPRPTGAAGQKEQDGLGRAGALLLLWAP